MKAANRSREVNVSYNSAAEVRNSSLEVTVVVLINGPLLPPEVAVELDLGFAFAWAAVEEVVMVVGVANPDEGLEPGACWISLPCSAMSVGPSFCKALRS